MKKMISTIEVPVSTLNALKNMLFSEEGGVNLSSIVEDLTVGTLSRDLVAINVGLTFKGIKPEIDKTTRYCADYRDLVEYTFVSYSMILDTVTVRKKIIARWDSEKNDLCPYNGNDEGYLEARNLQSWYELETDRFIPTNGLVKRWAKKDE